MKKLALAGLALVAMTVSAVAAIETAEIHAPPSLEVMLDADLLQSVATGPSEVFVLSDIDGELNSGEMLLSPQLLHVWVSATGATGACGLGFVTEVNLSAGFDSRFSVPSAGLADPLPDKFA